MDELNIIIDSINKTIENFNSLMILEVLRGKKVKINMDKCDFDDVEFFMEDLNENLPNNFGFDNKIVVDAKGRNLCIITIHKL